MSYQIEEIRKRIKAASDNTDEPGYDEFESGQGVGLATALQIIDEVVKEHPVPDDVQAASRNYADKRLLENKRGLAESGHTRNFKMGYVCFAGYEIEEAFADGMLAERERLASCPSFKGWVARDKCGELYFFAERPTRGATMWNTEDFCAFMPFPQRNLPSIRWEDEPREVEIIIKEVGK